MPRLPPLALDLVALGFYYLLLAVLGGWQVFLLLCQLFQQRGGGLFSPLGVLLSSAVVTGIALSEARRVSLPRLFSGAPADTGDPLAGGALGALWILGLYQRLLPAETANLALVLGLGLLGLHDYRRYGRLTHRA